MLALNVSMTSVHAITFGLPHQFFDARTHRQE